MIPIREDVNVTGLGIEVITANDRLEGEVGRGFAVLAQKLYIVTGSTTGAGY
jgi:hypothetical protein